MSDVVNFDFGRCNRIGLSEAVLCEGKTVAQLEHVVHLAVNHGSPLLLTRMEHAQFASLDGSVSRRLDYDPVSRTAIMGPCRAPTGPARVCVATAGTSDLPVAREACRTLGFYGAATDEICDVGVAGLWRILERREELCRYRVVITVAGMDGALFSVMGGLVPGAVIAVPTATGYGAAGAGSSALHAALASCAPGVVVVNIGNGYGAACAAIRILGGRDQP